LPQRGAGWSPPPPPSCPQIERGRAWANCPVQ
jgi:hypothetical protein